jgi:hypothetical protein
MAKLRSATRPQNPAVDDGRTADAGADGLSRTLSMPVAAPKRLRKQRGLASLSRTTGLPVSRSSAAVVHAGEIE